MTTEPGAPPSGEQLQREMLQYANQAVKHARDHYTVELDYSEESIGELELVLGRLGDMVPRSFFSRLVSRHVPKDDEIFRIALVYGAYLGEVLRQHHGGEWMVVDVHGEPTVALEFGPQMRAFPCTKVQRRIRNGENESVLEFYKEVIAKLL